MEKEAPITMTDTISVQTERHSVVICVVDADRFRSAETFKRLLDDRFRNARATFESYLRTKAGFNNV